MFSTRQQAYRANMFRPLQEVQICRVDRDRYTKKQKPRPIRLAAQPSPEEAAKMQEAMQQALKDPQASQGLWTFVVI